MPYRVGPLYASMAKEDGEVISITDKQITVKYKSGLVGVTKIGIQYGRMEGSVYPHSIVTDLTIGKRFKKGDYLAFNEGFFEKCWLEPTKLVMKTSRNVTVALTASDETYEDSCAISSRLSASMSTSVIKEKVYIIESNKNIINLLEVGSKVDPSSVLFSVVDENTDYSNLSETSVDLLQNLATLSPRAKLYGELERYEIKYNGEVADMSPTFRKLANKLDKDLDNETKGTEYAAKNNRVSAEYRSGGKNLNVDTIELKVFVRINLSMSTGDKSVLGNQLKNVISDVFTSSIKTESNVHVDAFFSYIGILARVVNSPILLGTTNRLVKEASKQLVNIYFNKK